MIITEYNPLIWYDIWFMLLKTAFCDRGCFHRIRKRLVPVIGDKAKSFDISVSVGFSHGTSLRCFYLSRIQTDQLRDTLHFLANIALSTFISFTELPKTNNFPRYGRMFSSGNTSTIE